LVPISPDPVVGEPECKRSANRILAGTLSCSETLGMEARARFTVEQRQQLLEDFQQSGLGVTEFARQKGLSRVLLSVWLRRYVRQPLATVPTTELPATVPLREVCLGQVLGQPSWAAELVLPSGVAVRLDANGLAQLVPELQRRLRQ
jgi:transposase-like protein